MNKTLSKWHEFINAPAAEILDEILAPDVKFHSPFVWKPKDGKMITIGILLTVTTVFQDFWYVREIVDGNHFCLEFEARVGEFTLRGVDLITIDSDGKIIDFEVMVRPANALGELGRQMTQKLTENGVI